MTTPVIWTSFVDVVNNVWNLDLSRCFLTSGLDGRTNDSSKMNKIQGLIDKYKSTCTVPKHPKACPECGEKVGVYHLNYSEAVFMCSNEECVWPLVTHDPEEILGKSDVATLVKIKVEKEAQNDSHLSDSLVSDEEEEEEDEDCNQELPLTKSSSSEPQTSNSIHSIPSESVEPQSLSKVSNDISLDSSKAEQKKQTIAADKANSLANQELSELIIPSKELANEKDEDHEGGSDQEMDSDHGPDPESSDVEQESETNDPRETNEEKGKEATAVVEETKDSSFEETMDMPPQLLSPIAPSPATPLQEKTPFRDDDDEFLRPSSAIGTPRRGLATPLHLPIPISPLPPTPQRGSERSINLDYDLQLTDSEWSDVESTPRHAPKCSEDLDMPRLFASPKLKHSYSKDLDRIVANDNSIAGTPMKLKLKRQSGHDWNVENSAKDDDDKDAPEDDAMEVLPDRPAVSGKLDKVVLNLKKSVTGNTWNVAEKNQVQAVAAADVQATQNSCGVTTAPFESPAMNAPRRGRKSKVAPMKIQNVQLLAKEQENGPDEQLVSLKSNVPKAIESSTVQNSQPEEVLPSSAAVATNIIENVDEIREKIDLPSQATTKSIFDEDAFERPDLFSREKPKVKTFSRKKKLPPLVKIVPAINSNDDVNWTEVAELSSRAANAFQQKDDFNEFCQLMKAATGENQVGLNFIQKVQKKLCNTHGSGARSQVTFHVGQNKANIDLPTEESSMAVNDSSSAVQVMLSAESDGIVGDVLKVKEPVPQIVQDHRKRGRPSKPRLPAPPSPPPTMVPPPMTNMGHQFFMSAAAENSQDFHLFTPATIKQFKRNLDQLMESYQPPPDLPSYIDPFIAMMVTRAREPAYQSIDFSAMLYFYEQIIRSESCQPMQSSGAASSGGPDNTISSPAIGNERSYAELQTVRGGGQVTDANQVLLQHQRELNASHEELVDVPDTSVLVSENQDHQEQSNLQGQQQQQHSQQQRLVIKQEAMTPPQFHDNAVGSVRLLSVRPNQNPKSVQEYSQGKIGRGQKLVQFTYKNSNFGPLYVDTENEVKAIVALTQEKIKEREYRDKHGGRRSTGVTPASEATSARSILPKDIVEYIDKAFTKKGMKENIIGRKKRNYPKRSKVIKEDPVTKELILPNGDRMINTSTIKKDLEPLHLNNVPALPPPLANAEENLDDDPLAFDEDPNVDEDLPNPLNKDELLMLPKSPPKPAKISSSLFKKRKNKKTTVDKAKAEHVEMINNILYNHELEKTQQSGNSSGYHGIGTRQQTCESSASSSATSDKIFDPTALFEQTFIRKDQTEKVKRLLEKKKKKEEREQRKAVKRSQKYAGIGQPSKNEAKRFKKAPQPIDGRKMVIKESGDIVQVNKNGDVQQGSSKDNNVTQGELDFVDQLIRMGEQAFCSESSQSGATAAKTTTTTLDFNPPTSSQTTRHNLPEFDFHFDTVQEKDFSSLDDIFT